MVVDDLDKSETDAQRFLGGVSDAQANWHPSQTIWSMVQCVDHLARINIAYAAALLDALQDVRNPTRVRLAPIKPPFFSSLFIRTLEPPPGRKLRSPSKGIPSPQVGREEVFQAFVHSHDNVRTVIREGASRDLNRIRFKNPFIEFLRFTVGAGLLIITTHDRRHLWQAEQVRKSVGFPV
jgi:hypothetical protein